MKKKTKQLNEINFIFVRYNSLDVRFSLECNFLYFGGISQSGGAN